MIRILMLLATTLGITACGGSVKRSHDLQYDVRAYNEGVRWVKLPQAASHILPSEREDFLNQREELEEELRIDDFEIMRLKMEGDSQETAKVQIRWTWHMDREGIVKTTTSRQDWRRYGSRWIMLKEAHLRGDEMPGINHKVKEDEEADEKENNDDSDDVPRDEDSKKSVIEETRSPDAFRQVQEQLRVAFKSHRIAE